MIYANGDSVSYSYDFLGRKAHTTTSDGDAYHYRYTGEGQLFELEDEGGNLRFRYLYDSIGRLIGSSMQDGDTLALRTWHQYDANNRLTMQRWSFPNIAYSTNYRYDSNGRLYQLYHTLPTGATYNTLAYDDLGRLSIGYTTQHRREYQYAAGSGSNGTTNLVSQLQLITSKSGGFATKTYNFSYNSLGNITQIVGPEGTTNYSYDVQGQLTQASRNNHSQIWNYRLDSYGNLRWREYQNGNLTEDELNYSYGDTNWLDKLTAVSGTKGGTAFSGTYSYDEIGNPTSFYNVGDLSQWTLSWNNGRELATASNGTQSLSYDYDVNGLRTKKTVNGITHSYVYASGKLLRDSWTESGLFCAMDFFYDYAGNPYAVFYQKGTAHQRFYYLTNLQGDVIGMVNTSSQLVAEYDYDPYGNLISITGTTTGTPLAQEVHQANPLRYRGYYLDQETGWYYLQSRYYDPMLGRFLNADSYASTGTGFLGYNMFAYCNNCPLSFADPMGTDAVVLYDESQLGHIGFLVQDCDGEWHHYYWGSVYAGTSSSALCIVALPTIAREDISTYKGPITVKDINKYSNYKNYTDLVYLQGDFSMALIEAEGKADQLYNLYFNNCSQHSLGLLSECPSMYKKILEDASDKLLPSSAFEVVLKCQAADSRAMRKHIELG